MRTKRRIGVVGERAAGAPAVVLALAVALLSACRDAPERAREAVDTAALEDRRIFEGEIGRDTGGLMPDSLATADSLATDREPTLVLAADSAAGFLLYHRSAGCLACHGADAEGLDNLGPSLRDREWLHIDGSLEAIERVIRDGIARPRTAMIAMPAVAAQLQPAEIRRVAAYVYALSHPAAVVADTAAARDSLRALSRDSLAVPTGSPPPDTTLLPAPHAQARRHQR